jgi:hypothetical protein
LQARTHHPPTIVAANVIGQDVRHGVPVAGRKARQESFIRTASSVFEPPRLRARLLEVGKGGVDVVFFVDFQPRLFVADGEEKHTRPLQFASVNIGAFDDEFDD